MQSRGVALVITLIALAVFSALGLGLVLTTASERLTHANVSDATHALNAADAAMELAAHELGLVADWNSVLSGVQRSRFTDGVPGGRRTIAGRSIDLTALTNEITCGRRTACSDLRRALSTDERPWGANNPQWQLFLHGSLSAFTGGRLAGPDVYVIVWVGDDAREVDDNPLIDGESAGRDVVRARADSFTAAGSRRAVEADLVRSASGIRVQSWRVRAGSLP